MYLLNLLAAIFITTLAPTFGAHQSFLVRPVPSDYVSPPIKLSEALSENEIQILKEEAVVYANSHAEISPFEDKVNATKKLIDYMMNVIDDLEFQKDPVAYMKAWTQKRGYTKEFRMIEDSAKAFFEEIFGA